MKLSEVCCIGRGYIDGDVICKLSKFLHAENIILMDLIERCGFVWANVDTKSNIFISIS